ncbi:MAG: hypothetical protein M3041_08870 [Acidobacteriota bacterium]|nr:hypothetical protein [Acidobacteriota bacterium]
MIAIFIGGLLVGIAGDRFYLFHRHRLFPSEARERFATRRIVEHLDRDLHLSPQQKIDIQRIIDQHHVRIDSVMTGIQPQVHAELEAANAEIDKLLTPPQREEFKKIRMRIQARRHGFAPPPPPY